MRTIKMVIQDNKNGKKNSQAIEYIFGLFIFFHSFNNENNQIHETVDSYAPPKLGK